MEIMEIMDWSRRLSSGNCAVTIFLMTQADTRPRPQSRAGLRVRIVSYLLWLRAGPLPRICRSSWWSAAVLTAPSPCWIAAAGANTDLYHRHLVTAEIVPRVSLLTAHCRVY